MEIQREILLTRYHMLKAVYYTHLKRRKDDPGDQRGGLRLFKDHAGDPDQRRPDRAAAEPDRFTGRTDRSAVSDDSQCLEEGGV